MSNGPLLRLSPPGGGGTGGLGLWRGPGPMARIDRMTTSGDLAVLSVRGYFQRLRANWPAVLPPVVAVGTLGLLHNELPRVLLIATLLLAAVAPKRSAKLAPYAFLAYGAYGFFLPHSLEVWEAPPGTYGLVPVGPADNVPWVLPQAVACVAVGV